MSALKWHLCDRLWEIKPPMRIVTVPSASTDDETDRPDDEQVTVAEEDERAERAPEPPRMLRIVAM